MIRDYKPSDEMVLRALHAAQGHSYPFPDINSFVGVLVATDENDVPVMAVAARKTVEIYMLGDPNWRTPAWRMRMFSDLHNAMHAAIKALGFTDSHCWLPPSVEKAFGRRLERDFGWIKEKWNSWCRYL